MTLEQLGVLGLVRGPNDSTNSIHNDRRRLPLTGRRAELAFCTEVLARSDGTGIVITGAAGVGKTRLATEVLRAAQDAGFAATRVTATEAGRTIPFGPFAQLLPADADTAPTPLQLLRLARAELSGRSEGRPLALLVDDGHLLDAASCSSGVIGGEWDTFGEGFAGVTLACARCFEEMRALNSRPRP